MTRLTLLHTNDLHGRIQPLFRIATLAKQIRSEVKAAGGYCALWDAGDAEDTLLLESSLTKGGAMMALLHCAGYDLETLGNASPVRYGPQVIQNLAEKFGRRLLCANMIDQNTGRLVDGLAPYTIETFGEIKVGVIGLTASMSFYSTFFKLAVGDPLAVLPDLITQVRSLGAQTVALLSHIASANDRKIAEQVAGLDLIIGGHDHVALNPPLVVNGTIIAQAGQYGQFLGRLDLEIDPETGRIARHHGELIPVGEEIPPDLDAQAAFRTEQARARQIMQRVIGELRDPIDLAEDRQCAAGNLLADALLDRVKGAQVALVLAGHWTTGLEAGSLTFGALNTAIRSPGNPARLELTGAQIMQFLREALKPENAARKPHEFRPSAVGMPHVAGMTVRRSADSPASLDIRIGGEPLRPDQTCVVAGTDAEFSGFTNYLVIPDDQIEFEVPTIVPEVLEDYIARHSPLSAPSMNRITV